MDALAAVELCGRTRQGLAPLAALVAAGADKRRVAEAASPAVAALARVRPGVYAVTPLPPWPRHAVTQDGPSPVALLHVRAVLLSLGPGATACARTAAMVRGWGLLVEPRRALDVAVEHGRSRARLSGVRFRQRRELAREEVVVLAGHAALWVTTALQTALDCLMELPLVEAVVAVDSALRARSVTAAQLDAAVAALPGRREAGRARRALALCDERSGSVLESVLRVRMTLAGISGFVTQKELHDSGGTYVLRVDFCFEAARLVVEADGARWHPDPGVDRVKDNRLAAAGWRVLRFTWAEVVHETDWVIDLIRAAVAHVVLRTDDVHLIPGAEAQAA